MVGVTVRVRIRVRARVDQSCDITNSDKIHTVPRCGFWFTAALTILFSDRSSAISLSNSL